MVINQAVQVLIVRYLTQREYGAFALALSVVALGEAIVTFGLDRAITRFVPIYHEQRDYNKMFGTLFLVISTVVSLGLAVILVVYGFQDFVVRMLLNDQPAVSQQAAVLLLITVFLAPVQAIDTLMVGMFAVFASPRSIFFRKHVLGPGLKLVVVLLLIFGNSNVYFLAGGYLAAGVLGVVIYSFILFRLLRNQGLLAHFNWKTIRVPAREVLFFTVPLLSTDLVYVLMTSMDALLLAHYGGTADVAAFRAVQPTARLNQAVFASFTLLFSPLAARMFARKDREGINNLYWQTAIWIAVISFPIFVLTFSLAKPLTLLLYGKAYEQSAVILALLSLGYYFNAALGFNGTTLTIFKKIRYSIVINVLAGVVNLGINLILIPRYGAFGAAVGTCATLLAHNILKQVGLRFGTGIRLFEWRYLKIYLSLTAGTLTVLLIQWLTPLPMVADFIVAAAVSVLVVGMNRKALNVGETFPEVLRIPFVRRIFT